MLLHCQMESVRNWAHFEIEITVQKRLKTTTQKQAYKQF